MIPVIRKILYCSELSDSPSYVFRYAASLAHQYGAGMTILHVMEDVPEGSRQLISSEIGASRWEEIKKQNAQEAHAVLKARKEKFLEKARSEQSDFSFTIESILVKLDIPSRRSCIRSKPAASICSSWVPRGRAGWPTS